MKTTKQIICIFLALTFALLVGCKDNSLPVDKVVAETDGHILFYSGEDCYLKFFDPGYDPTDAVAAILLLNPLMILERVCQKAIFRKQKSGNYN